MKNEGWTLADLDGELRALGINLEEVPDACLTSAEQCRSVEQAAEFICHGLGGQ